MKKAAEAIIAAFLRKTLKLLFSLYLHSHVYGGTL